ncbi:MAG: indolepyruvate oxidoreductase subunit beta [Bacteroidales bacterium]|jgi:indolepyruvate ferredoxin oxidoreductase beta subunit|nr:indolepyruvate oxidoreductase subunit beta [Bacteroidales bacterium]MBQ2395796.1 indolepyruvate oxidoreductase subunit beta [Bacteroidales bacterium]MBQ5874101.1 indolepyruvate oxidoreductase subunit beta [Bacteroidales bacterium]MBR5254792.1 indolepyruvate oxidoreductase subunit beta [Bacteroidales bacterium]MED9962156.1 indolepyruvate oxidoreductase subunit beta [Bacteroidales bacterium]
MKIDIILCGVGGMGALSSAAIISKAALSMGMYMKQAETHGMSQRGGDVQSHLRLSDQPIASDLIPEGECDIILSVEPMEALRYLPFLNKETGWIITNQNPFVNIPNYPDLDAVLGEVKKIKNHILFDADKIAKEVNNPKGTNMVVLGAASKYLRIDIEKLEDAVRSIFGKKGDAVVDANISALRAGRAVADKM